MARQALLYSVLITAACAAWPDVREVSVSPGFSREMVARDGLAVVAITPGTAKQVGEKPFTPSGLALQLTEALKEAQEEWRLAEVDETVVALGEDSYNELVQSFDRSGDISEREVGQLADLLGQNARFCLLGRIVEDRNFYTSSYSRSRCEGKREKVYTTTRRIVVEVRVYDTWRRLPAWSATLEHSNKQWLCSDPLAAGALIFGLLDALFGPEREPGEELEHPEPPDLEFMIESFFRFSEGVTSLSTTVPPRESRPPTD